MIIKITPETDAEKLKMQEVEHSGVKEFFIFGNKKDADNDPIDFHDWSGAFRYLIGSLYFFTKMLENENDTRAANKPQEINLQVASPEPQEPQIIPMELAENKDVLIKTSNIEDGQIEGVVEVKKGESNVTDFPGQKLADETDEMVVEEDAPVDSSKAADDEPENSPEK